MYWINAKTNPPKENEKIIGLDRCNRTHPMIFRNGWYYFYCITGDNDFSYAVNELAFPLWYIPTPKFEEDAKKLG
jgi:hypothetical protein